MSNEIELRPCPFCGQPVTFEGNRFVCGGCDNPNWYFEPENEVKAIAEWNTRPIEDAQAAEIERLKAGAIAVEQTVAEQRETIDMFRGDAKTLRARLERVNAMATCAHRTIDHRERFEFINDIIAESETE
jgi:hypothetical protein